MPRDKYSQEPKVGPAIRKRRKQLQMTLQALSDASGVSVGYLSQVERDNATPSLGTLAQVSTALKVELDYFISATKPSDGLTRAHTRPLFALDDSSLRYEALGADFTGAEMSSYILHIPAGYVSETVSHEGEEIIFVLEGEIEQILDEQTFRMTAGDSLHYSGETPHAWSNTTGKTARLLWTGTLTVLNRKNAIELPELSPASKG